jgi:ArsR family transcriptional regulator, zinc-responsive transcriptional repressor
MSVTSTAKSSIKGQKARARGPIASRSAADKKFAPVAGGFSMPQIRAAAQRLKQLSDPTRAQIVLGLVDGERNVGDMAVDLRQSQPATSHHLALLRHGGVIQCRRDGKNNLYELTDLGRTLSSLLNRLVN